jgi:hypothetical protein
MMAEFKGPLDYIDVATRIIEFREKFPEGSLQQVDLKFIDFAGKSWVVYTAAAYRSPEDTRPGIGTAWEPVPGPTKFTRDSEVQNAETAAWGRAMVAALAVDTRKGIASSEEVRNRQEPERPKMPELTDAQKQVRALLIKSHPDTADRKFFLEAQTGRSLAGLHELTEDECNTITTKLSTKEEQ